MGQYSFKSHTTTLSKDGFAALPEEVIELCKEAIIFYKHSGVFVLCDADAFREFQEKVLELDDKNIIALRRHVYISSLNFETVENLTLILWDLIDRYERKYADASLLEIEMSPYKMVYFGEESKNQFIEIKILDDSKPKLEQQA